MRNPGKSDSGDTWLPGSSGPCWFLDVPTETLSNARTRPYSPALVTAVIVDGRSLTLDAVRAVALDRAPVEVHPEARARMLRARAVVDEKARGTAPVYGVNTGFGLLADKKIPPESLEKLQVNLLRSHAAGVGDPLPATMVRAVMVLRANVLATGHAGTRPEVLDYLVAMLNHEVHPVVPRQGSVGASGDLAPLSHLALVLIGEGRAQVRGRELPGLLALRMAGLEPLKLAAKEGLSLVNGTQVMTGIGALALISAERLARAADIAGALTVEALKGTPRAFDARLTAVRTHPGGIVCNANIARLLADSEIAKSHSDIDDRVQDPYSLRCMPAVHGAVRDAHVHIRQVLETEINACTDNPLVYVEGDGISNVSELLSGGNFHGQPASVALDYLGLATASLGAISERRTEQMVNPRESRLPAFLTDDPGLKSGFMMAHVTAAALVSENKIHAHPASVDTIPTSGGQEDHVSMGVTAALKADQIVRNVARVLAIELLAGARGVEFHQPLAPGKGVATAHAALRKLFPATDEDRPLGGDIDRLAGLILDGWLENELKAGGFDLR